MNGLEKFRKCYCIYLLKGLKLNALLLFYMKTNTGYNMTISYVDRKGFSEAENQN